MSIFKANSSQIKVLQSKQNLSVVAGAGSGKTSTLIALIIKSLEDFYENGENLSIINILALTFSEKAAKELNLRLIKAFEEKINLSVNKDETFFWLEQNKKLEMAEIGTIHGYALNVLRKYSLFINLNANLTIESQENAFQKNLKNIILDLLNEKDEDLLSLLKVLPLEAYYKYSPNIMAYITHTLLKMSSWGLAEIYVNEIKIDNNSILEKIELFIIKLKHALEFIENFKGRSIWKESSKEAIINFMCDLENFNLDKNLETNLKKQAQYFAIFKNWSNADWKLIYQDLKDEYSKINLADFIINPLKIKFSNLVKKVYRKLNEQKLKTSVLNFDDILIFARRLLAQYPLLRQKEINKFKLIIVDEFQDTNRLQADVLAYLLLNVADDSVYNETHTIWDLLSFSEIHNRLKVVGDPKQAIYRFRGAESRLMQNLNDTFIRGSENTEVLALDTNYRSQENLVNFFNDFFKDYFITGEINNFTNLDLQKNHRKNLDTNKNIIWLNSSESFKKLNILEKHKKNACLLINYLSDLFSGKLNTFLEDEFGNKRLPGFSDVTLLFRRFKYAFVYEEAFKKKGWPVELLTEENILLLEEIKALIFAFAYLHNIDIENNLIAFLKSPLINLNENLLAKINFKITSFFKNSDVEINGLTKLENSYLNDIKLKLEKIKKLIYRSQDGEIFEKLVKSFAVIPFLLSLKNGAKKVKSIKGFLAIIKTLNYDYNKEKTLAEDLLEMLNNNLAIENFLDNEHLTSNSIKIMTIHRSKGLEFPIVILPELDYTESTQSASIVMNSLGVVSFKILNQEKNFTLEPRDFNKILLEEKNYDLLEEKRIFYVAVSRAKDYLVFLGNKSEKLDKNSWADALAKWLMLDESRKNYIEFKEISSAFIEEEKVENFITKKELICEEFAMDQLKNVWESKSYFLTATDLSLALTNFTKYYETKYLNYNFYEKNVFDQHSEEIDREVKTNENLLSSDLGNVYHKTLESLNSITTDEEIIKILKIQSSVYGINLTSNNLNMLLEKVNNFYNSNLGAKLKTALVVYKEMPFYFNFGEEYKLLISGSIDLFFVSSDNVAYVVDYKLAEYKENSENLLKYEYQLKIYVLALKKFALKNKVKAFLFFAKGKKEIVHEVDLNNNLEKEIKNIKSKLINLRKLNMLKI